MASWHWETWLSQGDYTAARSCYEESLALQREIGQKRAIASSLNLLGKVAHCQCDDAAARAHYQEGLALWQETGDKRHLAACLEGLAGVAGAEGRPELAARLFGAAAALRDDLAIPLPALDRTLHERDVAAVRAALGEEPFATAWAEGRSMTLEQVTSAAFARD